MDSTISMEELNYAVKKSPIPDGITNEMLINAGKPALYKFLKISTKQCNNESSRKENLKQKPQATYLSASQVAQLRSLKES